MLACRACISALVPAALLQSRCSHRLLVPLVAGLACVAPAATGFVRLRAELGVATAEAISGYLPGAAAGAALTAGTSLPLNTISCPSSQRDVPEPSSISVTISLSSATAAYRLVGALAISKEGRLEARISGYL